MVAVPASLIEIPGQDTLCQTFLSVWSPIVNEYQKLYETTLSAFKQAFENSRDLNHEARVDLINQVQSLLNKEILELQDYLPRD